MSEVDCFFLHPYYKVMRFFMILIGQWPYDQSKTQSVIRAVVCLVFAFCGHAQIRKLIACSDDFTVFIQVFPPVVINVLCFMKYCTCWIAADLMRGLLEHLKKDWSTITVKDEMEILENYTNIGRILGVYYMHILIPLDTPRPRKPFFEADFFANQEEHFFLVVILCTIIILVMFTVSGASDLIYLCYMLHGCGTFRVLGYRLEHMFDSAITCVKRQQNKEELFYLSRKVAECVQLHCRIIKYVRLTIACYDLAYLIQLLLSIILLSGLFVHLCDALTVLQSINESIGCIVHLSGLLFIIFLNILPAQLLLNTSAEIHHQAYFSRWFAAPRQMQKSLVIIMQNSIKPRGLCAYSFVTASLQIFATIVQTSVSYFTVLYSIR